MKWADALGLVTGSTVLVAGLGLAAIAASRRQFPAVFLGFVLFTVGYRISQVAVRQTEETDLQLMVSDILEGAQMGDLLMTLVGLGAVAYGFFLLFNSFTTTDLPSAFLAAAVLFTGFMTAHYGVNRALV